MTESAERGISVKKRSLRTGLSLALAILMMLCTAISTAALNDVYRFDAFGMSVKLPKSYYVITRDTPADDPVFTSLQLNYQDTMSAFRRENIYLRAFDPEGVFQLSLTISKNENSETIGNYSDLTESEQLEILNTLKTYDPDAKKVNIGDFVFYQSSRESEVGESLLYSCQYNTIVNGLQIDFTLRKSDEPVIASEGKALTSLVTSMEFDVVERASSGPVFDWWRLMLWAAILAALTIGLSVLARHRNNVRHRQMEERRRKREQAAAPAGQPAVPVIGDQDAAFDEMLGYRDVNRFSARAGADLDTFDINVREKDPDRGVSFFEDGGKSIDDRSGDYFDAYFKESTPARSGISRLFSAIGAYIGIAIRHVGYFFRNLFRRFGRRKP